MNLKQYTRQKRRNPLILFLSIALTLFLVITIIKKLNLSGNTTHKNTQIVLVTNVEHVPETAFPLILMINNEILKIYNSQLPNDTSFTWNLQEDVNSILLLNKNYNVIYYDSVSYKKEAVTFVKLKPHETK